MNVAPFRTTYASDVVDEDIAWLFHVYKCYAQARWCLKHLRASYPTSRVVMIADGDNTSYEELADEFRCSYVRGEHLHRLVTCDQYVRRMLTAFSEGRESYCIKIDPDTRIWRRLHHLPAFSSVFGTLETVSEGDNDEIRSPPNVQGGCIGMTRDAVQAMLASPALDSDECVARCTDTWARCVDMTRVIKRGSICDDFVVSWLAWRTGIAIVDCPDVRSRWRQFVGNGSRQYAVTHPHKIEP
jgi:hypothetical protein